MELLAGGRRELDKGRLTEHPQFEQVARALRDGEDERRSEREGSCTRHRRREYRTLLEKVAEGLLSRGLPEDAIRPKTRSGPLENVRQRHTSVVRHRIDLIQELASGLQSCCRW